LEIILGEYKMFQEAKSSVILYSRADVCCCGRRPFLLQLLVGPCPGIAQGITLTRGLILDNAASCLVWESYQSSLGLCCLTCTQHIACSHASYVLVYLEQRLAVQLLMW